MRVGPGTVVVVTGASAGIGRAIAAELGRRGCHLGLIARGRDRLRATKAEVERLGGRAVALEADVADPQAVDRAAERTEQAFGPIDLWINCAMVTVFAAVADITPQEFRRVTDVTYHGYVWGTMAALRRMRPRNRGTIVQVGSALAYRGIPLQAAYCGAKHAIRGFTDGLRSELIHDGSAVRLSMVQLPAHNTPQFDWGRNRLERRPQPVPPIYQPEVAARAIIDAAERAPRELWLGFSAMQAIVGGTVAPRLADRVLAHRGYDGQMSDEPARPGPDNLYAPVPGAWAAHGRFDGRAKSSAPQVDQEFVPLALAASAVGLGAVLLSLGVAAGRRLGRNNALATSRNAAAASSSAGRAYRS